MLLSFGITALGLAWLNIVTDMFYVLSLKSIFYNICIFRKRFDSFYDTQLEKKSLRSPT